MTARGDESEMVGPCRCGNAECPDTKRLADARALWAYRALRECALLRVLDGDANEVLCLGDNVIVNGALALLNELPAETRSRLGECP